MNLKTEFYINLGLGIISLASSAVILLLSRIVFRDVAIAGLIISIILVLMSIWLFWKSLKISRKITFGEIADSRKCDACTKVLSTKEMETNFCYTCGKEAKSLEKAIV